MASYRYWRLANSCGNRPLYPQPWSRTPNFGCPLPFNPQDSADDRKSTGVRSPFRAFLHRQSHLHPEFAPAAALILPPASRFLSKSQTDYEIFTGPATHLHHHLRQLRAASQHMNYLTARRCCCAPPSESSSLRTLLRSANHLLASRADCQARSCRLGETTRALAGAFIIHGLVRFNGRSTSL